MLTGATQKGGTGNTMLCQVLGNSLASDMKVVVIDADPTGALSRWVDRAYEGAAFEALAEADETRLAHLIVAKADAAGLVLVDTAGFGNRAATVAMTSADSVLVPSLVGEADVTEAERTIGLVAALARAARRDIPARVMLNRVKRTTLAEHVMSEMTTAGLRFLAAVQRAYSANQISTTSGGSPGCRSRRTRPAGSIACSSPSVSASST